MTHDFLKYVKRDWCHHDAVKSECDLCRLESSLAHQQKLVRVLAEKLHEWDETPNKNESPFDFLAYAEAKVKPAPPGRKGSDMEKRELKVGEIMQLNPEMKNRAFAGCLFVVSEPKSFGAQGYVQALGIRDEIGGQAYLRPSWEDMEPTGGMAPWLIGSAAGREG